MWGFFIVRERKEGMHRLRLVFLVLVLVFSIGVDVFAQFNDVELERITVTAIRYPQEIQKISASVSVITQQDIENSNAQTIPDILRTQTGIVVRDYYGNGAKVSVDLRGFGETAGSNTLVLLDGRRVNEIDLSGVDWTQVPLDRIERIEIVRGSGSVLYGDNATGGVINIITKTGKGKPQFELESSGGSYDMNKQRFSVSGSQGKLSYFLSTSRNSTHGYRKNSYHKAGDFSSKLIYNISDTSSLGLSAGHHTADYGLPADLKEDELSLRSRRDAATPDDHAGDEDWYIHLEAKKEFQEGNKFNLALSLRKRHIDTFWLGGDSVDNTRIETVGICPKLILNSRIFKKTNITTLGLDFYKHDSTVDNFFFGAQTGDSDIDKKSQGIYLQNQLSIFDNLTSDIGFRYERAKYGLVHIDSTGWYADIDDTLKFDEELFESGLTYNYNEDSKLFLNVARSFRFPATEEFMMYAADYSTRWINKDLLPQKSFNYEIGIDHKFNPKLNMGLSLFMTKVKNELYLNPFSRNNENYNKTQHRGIELSSNSNIFNNLNLLSNYTFTEAIFDGGIFNNNQVPMVPRHKISIVGNWQMNPEWQLSTFLNYVGSRYLISDPAHNHPKLDEFITIDLKLSYRLENFIAFLGINNLFDETYSEYGGVSIYTGEIGYYPSPARNFIAGCTLNF